MKLKTIKVTEQTIKDLNFVAGAEDKPQYKVAEEAAAARKGTTLEKILAKIKKQTKSKN